MKKRFSITTRMMISTSLLLVVISILFTVFSIFNAYFNLLLPFEQLDITPSPQTAIVDASSFLTANLIFLAASIVVGCALTYLVAKLSLRPLKRWSEEISAIDDNQLSRRIERPSTNDELDTLVSSFNQLLERLQKAFEREKRFSAAVAHELRTPLTVVKTNIEFLQMDEDLETEDYAETIEVVKKQNDRMIQVVRDLALLSTPDIWQESDEMNMDQIINEIENDLKLSMQSKNIRFEYNKAGIKMTGNPALMKHALSNLVENAIKYNVADGAIHVRQTIENGRYELSVSDTGIGIGGEDVPYIFEPFYRADKSRNRATGGSGLGLAITKEIIEGHGGSIEYQAGEEGGSKFTIYIPCSSDNVCRTDSN